MFRSVLLIFFLFIISQANSQSSLIYDELKTAYNYFDIAYNKIIQGQSDISYCYSIKNASQLRTQILYACTNPVQAKQYIDNAIQQVYRVQQRLQNMNCPMASSYAKYAREKFESARQNLQLGALAYMAASKARSLNGIYANMNNGAPHWRTSLNELNNAVDYLNKVNKEVSACEQSTAESKSSTGYLCEELIDYLVENGNEEASLPSYVLDSSWLNKVTFITYNNINFIIAQIKKDDFSQTTKDYIFCEIPNSDFQNFRFGNSGTYGERFQKYIFNYKCDCD